MSTQHNNLPGPIGSRNVTIAILNRYNLLLTVRGEDCSWMLPTRLVNEREALRNAVRNSIVGKLGVSRADLSYFDCIHQTDDFMAFRFMGEDAIINEGILKSPMSYNWQWLTADMLLDRCQDHHKQQYLSCLTPVLQEKRFIGF